MSAPENAPVRLGLAGNGQAAVVVYLDCQAVPPARFASRSPRFQADRSVSRPFRCGWSPVLTPAILLLQTSSNAGLSTRFVRSGSRPGSLSNDVISVRQIVGAGIDGEDQFVQITESSFDFFHAQQNCAV